MLLVRTGRHRRPLIQRAGLQTVSGAPDASAARLVTMASNAPRGQPFSSTAWAGGLSAGWRLQVEAEGSVASPAVARRVPESCELSTYSLACPSRRTPLFIQ